jgi:hypothetical protein
VRVEAYEGEDPGDFTLEVDTEAGQSDPCEGDGLALRQDGGTISFTEGYAEDKVCPPYGAAPQAVKRQGLAWSAERA